MRNFDEIKAFVYSIELRDIYTQGHSERVAIYSREFSKFLGLDKEAIDRVYIAGLLHDLGKVGIPDAILLKPGKLEKDEFEIVKMHSILSGDIVSKIDGFADLSSIVRHHHEHFDGSGYPDRLKGKEIPLLSRILTIVDVFDALTTKRVYRGAFSLEKALEIMDGMREKFDPMLYERFKFFIKDFGILKLNEFKIEEGVRRILENNVYFIDLKFKTLNREGLIAVFKQSADLGFFGSLVYLNVKNFREYNQKYGSKKGDDLLKKLVEEIKKYFRAETLLKEAKDGMNYLARINADRFYILSIGSKGNFLEYKLQNFIKNFKEVEIEYKFILKNEKLAKFKNKVDYLLWKLKKSIKSQKVMS